MHRPVSLFTLALVTGILLGQTFLFFPWSMIALIIALATVGDAITATARLGHQDLPITAAGAVAGFAILVAVTSHLPERHHRTMPVVDDAAHELNGSTSCPWTGILEGRHSRSDLRHWLELLLRQAVSDGRNGWWTVERTGSRW